MSSRRYQSLLIKYSADNGRVRIECLKLNPEIPLVSLLLARSLVTASKAEAKGKRLRNLEFFKSDREYEICCPYAPNEVTDLRAFIQQISQQPAITTVRYRGESS